MIGVDATQLNEWSGLDYLDPVQVINQLQFFRAITPASRRSTTDRALQLKMAKIHQWRVPRLQKYLEREQAAIFCYLLSRIAPDFEWRFAHDPASDYDCILRCHVTGEKRPWYKPVQLKELVPDRISPIATLQAEINKLFPKYCKSPNLIVAIYINRSVTINFKEISLPKLQIGQLWLFGRNRPDQFFLCGDLLGEPATHHIDIS